MLAESMAEPGGSSLRTTPNVSDAEGDDNDEYEPAEVCQKSMNQRCTGWALKNGPPTVSK